MIAGSKRTSRGALALGIALAALINAQALAGTHAPPCEPQVPTEPGPSMPPDSGSAPTTISTVGQAYYCIVDNYFNEPNLSSRALLVPAFAALTQELQRRGLDKSRAELPAFTGNRVRDWDAFSRTYTAITADLPATTEQALARTALQAMIDSLHDNHAVWQGARQPVLQVGVTLSVFRGPPVAGALDPAALEPMFVTAVAKNSPAELAGLRAGDEILAVNEVPLYVNGVLSEGVLEWITRPADGALLHLTLRRPVTNATFGVAVMPDRMPMIPGALVETKLLDGNVVYAKLRAFEPGAIDSLLQNIAELRTGVKLTGLVLDLRNNGGGQGEANARLLGAFARNVLSGYWCDARDKCTATRSDDSVALLNLPLVALIGRACISACDVFANAIKDARLGHLVGTRTGGMVSGPSYWYLLNDGSTLFLPKFYQLGARRQPIDTIGVAPHVYAPLTAMDLSAGRDPALTKALELLD